MTSKSNEPSLYQTQSINFPEADSITNESPSRTINHWPSETNLDNEIISPTQHPQTHERINFKIQAKDTERDLAIDFFGITYDSKLDIEAEQSYMSETHFEVNHKLATMKDFEELLTESRPIIHVSTHGQHKYKSVDQTNQFQISFEQTQTLRSLIDENEEFSAMYAVIALLFETEIDHFVKYGFEQYKHHDKVPLRTWMWRGHTDFLLLNNSKILAMLLTILDRFGCEYKENKAKQCIVIYWGYYQQKNGRFYNKKPHPPMAAYHLNTLLRHDDIVQNQLEQIKLRYTNSLATNDIIAKSLKQFQKFSWEILLILLRHMLLENDAMPRNDDDTKWNQDSKKNVLQNTINDDDGFDTDTNSFYDEDYYKTTSVKFGTILNLTREIKIIPKIEKDEYKSYSTQAKHNLAKLIRDFKHQLIAKLRKNEDIEIVFDADSSRSSNVHIVRFGNKNALQLAGTIISKQRLKPKIQCLYDIEFNDICKADNNTKQEVGYIKTTEPKLYSIDIKNKTDPICKALKKYLKSKTECKIKLLVINGCHSFVLGKIFSDYVENVICIHPYVQIWDSTATTFTKYFYKSLQENTNINTQLRQSVFEAYTFAKLMVAKECKNDVHCRSHSHRHGNVDDFKQIHFNENWDELQQNINDTNKFKEYRTKMSKSVSFNVDNDMDLYDDKTLIIANVSKADMEFLRLYLEEFKPEIIEQNSKKYLLKRQKSPFVKQYKHSPDQHYQELSVAFFKFKTTKHREKAAKILSEKQHEESCQLSKKLLLQKESAKNLYNLAWFHRKVPNCCCCPHHPHLSQDKLILIQNGKIVNRSMVDDLEEIQKVLHKMKKRKQQQFKKQNIVDENVIGDNNDNNSDEMEAVSSIKMTNDLQLENMNNDKSMKDFENVFGDNGKQKKHKKNNFDSPKHSESNFQ